MTVPHNPDPFKTRGPAPNSISTVEATNDYQATQTGQPAPPIELPSGPKVAGYIITSLIGKGGMGRVFAGVDLALEREVAIKMLLPQADARRFQNETRLTARLPHPGIPPVYATGVLEDGSPYMAMKFVRGKTLAELLSGRANPTEQVPQLVQAFEQIAQAVGFAHSRGIIHRDLKPLNIMIGEFGEVQVMDWGLAKELSNNTAEPVFDRGQNADEQLTQAGAIMGTPGYLAPEQARGEVVDARADVFSLGSILATILTGLPAFVSTSVWDTLDRAARADLADVLDRLDKCGADVDLVQIARDCLAAKPEDRPADARQVAEKVAAYRASVEERLRQAETERAEALVRAAEQQKRRRVWLGLAAVLLIGTVVSAGLAWWANSKRLQTAIAEKNSRDAATKATIAQGEAEEQRDLMLKLTTEIVRSSREVPGTKLGSQEIRDRILKASQVGLDQLRAKKFESPRFFLIESLLFLERGHVLANLSPPDNKSALVWFTQAAEQSQKVLSSSDSEDVKSAEEVRTEALFQQANSQLMLGQVDDSAKTLETYLAAALQSLKKDPKRIEMLAALIRYEQVSSIVAQQLSKPYAEMLEHSRKAWDMARTLLADNPDHELAHEMVPVAIENLAGVYQLGAQFEQVHRICDEGLALLEKINVKGKYDNKPWHYSMKAGMLAKQGEACMNQGRNVEAQKKLQIAGEMYVKLEQAFPAVTQYMVSTAEAYKKYAYLMWLCGEAKLAMFLGDESAKRFYSLLVKDPGNVTFQQGLADARAASLNSALQIGQFDSARDIAAAASKSFHDISKVQPDNISVRVVYANALFCEGLVARFKGEATAEKFFAQAEQEMQKLLKLGVNPDAALIAGLLRSILVKQKAFNSDAVTLAKIASELGKVEGLGWYTSYHAAGGYAQAARILLGQRKRAELKDAELKLVEAYEQQALNLLKMSFTLGLKNFEFIERDPELKPLHENKGFQELMQVIRKDKQAFLDEVKKNAEKK